MCTNISVRIITVTVIILWKVKSGVFNIKTHKAIYRVGCLVRGIQYYRSGKWNGQRDMSIQYFNFKINL